MRGQLHRAVVLALFVGLAACVPVGELQEETRSVEKGAAVSALVELAMGAGEFRVSGGARELFEGTFAYNVEKWKPEITYHVSGDRGRLHVRQGKSSGIPAGKGRNRWEIYLNEEIPLDLVIDFGAGEGRLNLEGLDLRSVNVDMGVGDLTIDLSGPRAHDMDVKVDGGVGAATLYLPSDIGVRVVVDKGIGSIDANGFVKRGGAFTNSAYGESEIEMDVSIDAGIGSIDLRLK